MFSDGSYYQVITGSLSATTLSDPPSLYRLEARNNRNLRIEETEASGVFLLCFSSLRLTGFVFVSDDNNLILVLYFGYRSSVELMWKAIFMKM